MLTQEIVRELLDYDPETGKLTWKERDRKWFKTNRSCSVWNIRYGKKEAFLNLEEGYFRGKITGKSHLAHRIIWLWMTGRWPEQTDHINHIRTDNRWYNLREVSNKGNSRNQSRRKDNISGQTGIHFLKKRQKWRVYIMYDKKWISLGYYDSYDDAVSARKAAELKYEFHKNHGLENFA